MAQESMKNKREQLKELMIRTRHMMWDDFLRFEGEQQKSRERERIMIEKKKAERTELIITVFAWGIGFCIIGGALFSLLPMILNR
jgi:preprotein translocase subunit Sss1